MSTSHPPPLPPDEKETVLRLGEARKRIGAELRKVIIGQDAVIEQLLIGMLAGGHCLITGAPGLAKTLLIKSIAQLFHLSFKRIQFTPDLMPADITGTEILTETAEGRRLVFVPGPLFANIVLADEINRTPPKTQAALLEAMQEHQITAAGQRHALEEPFFVLATKNPIEMEGTYPLPEAQLDRFMFDIRIDYQPEADEVAVISRTTSEAPEPISALFTSEDLLAFQNIVRRTPIAEEVIRHAVRIVASSRPGAANALPFVKDWVNWGAGPRAAQCLVLGGKARALLDGRTHVTIDDIHALAAATLRHRILPNYRAEAEGVSVDEIVRRLVASAPSL